MVYSGPVIFFSSTFSSFRYLSFVIFMFTDDSNKRRFESMQSMLEAKCAMNYLFEVATKHQMSIATQEADMKDLQVRDIANTLLYEALMIGL